MQRTVQRQYSTGIPGEIVRDGPQRLKPARIAPLATTILSAANPNAMSRAFGYFGNTATTDPTKSAIAPYVQVGGPNFYGVLAHPKHHVLVGTRTGGTLAPSLNLPDEVNAEFADMAIMIVELFNETTATKNVSFGDGLAYVPSNIAGADNPLALPFGAIVSYPAAGAAPTGFVVIKNARVTNPVSTAASALGALVSAYTIVQLTQ